MYQNWKNVLIGHEDEINESIEKHELRSILKDCEEIIMNLKTEQKQKDYVIMSKIREIKIFCLMKTASGMKNA